MLCYVTLYVVYTTYYIQHQVELPSMRLHVARYIFSGLRDTMFQNYSRQTVNIINIQCVYPRINHDINLVNNII